MTPTDPGVAVPPVPSARARRGAVAVFATFVLNGFTFANWLARIPTIRDELGLRPEQLGLIILVGSLGSLTALPVTGRILNRIGPVRTVIGASVVAAAGLVVAVTGVAQVSPLLVGAGLFLSTMGIGSWDVGMNFEGTRVEQALGRAIMPWFHGGFSIGTVLGAAVGGLAIRWGVPVPTHMLVVVGVAVVLVALMTRGFLPETAAQRVAAQESESHGGHSYLRFWVEPRTLMVGLVVLAAALTEGAANDWLALAVIDGFETPNETGAFGLTVFLTAMTVMRFLGTFLLDRFGRVAVLRLCTGLAIVGLLVFTLSPSLPVALVGAVLWGLGAALGFPVGMSAASDDPAKAAGRLSVVATIGYTAFLVGPGLLGLLASHVGYRHALLAILVPLVVGLLVIPAARQPVQAPDGVRPPA
ncbi:MFS transporter [Occultella glacieicola]|uniref:MFS transporter n=1 Tax=Occultella glacieicola TaxID=2518684 RepID=A0ABY2DWC9_9MICO|nr:MFS transporter [Occultella glacieicola]TDE88031.1 MFS transporter [Occultella glacieicola]